MLFGNLVLFELRVWGAAPALVRPLARLALALALSGFALAATSGLLMFASQSGELIANRVFLFKMALLVVLGGNAVAFNCAAD